MSPLLDLRYTAFLALNHEEQNRCSGRNENHDVIAEIQHWSL